MIKRKKQFIFHFMNAFNYINADVSHISALQTDLKLKNNIYLNFNSKEKKQLFMAEASQGDFCFTNGIITLGALAAKAGALFACYQVFFGFTSEELNQDIIVADTKKAISLARFQYDFITIIKSIQETFSVTNNNYSNANYIFIAAVYFGIAFLPIIMFDYKAYNDLSGYAWNIGWYLLALTMINIALYKHGVFKLNQDLPEIDDNTTPVLVNLKRVLSNDNCRGHNNQLKMILMFNIPYLVAFSVQMLRWLKVYRIIQSRCKLYTTLDISMKSTETIVLKKQELQIINNPINQATV